MSYVKPRTALRTHDVENMPPPLENINALEMDVALKEGLLREGGGLGSQQPDQFGRKDTRP
ncbi:MAG: hypothetical protein M0Q95_08050 [Porticoccaceae bacterium]|nr:hypothetical protein [Porticoccaceae bacterium]